MSDEITTTIYGNLTADPEIRFTNGGVPVCNFTVAHNKRVFDRAANEWKDGGTVFMRCVVWRELGEHFANSLQRGNRVIVFGELQQRNWEKDGEKRTVIELNVIEGGPSRKYAEAQVRKLSTRQDPREAAQEPAEEPYSDTYGQPGDTYR